MKRVLLTGGCGYIGSHALIQLLEKGYEVAVIDSLINSEKDSLDRIESFFKVQIPFLQNNFIDDLDEASKFIREFNPNFIMHFAGLKSVAESVKKPILYWEQNVVSTVNLVKILQSLENELSIIFSSSATIYKESNDGYFEENSPLKPISPYGITKLTIEKVLSTLVENSQNFSAVSLRYFNPVGASRKALTCENPLNIPNNIMPRLVQSALSNEKKFTIFGNDYDTHDDTCIRDYIHIDDLVKGHIKAMNVLSKTHLHHKLNLGTGNGVSVAEIVESFESSNNIKFNISVSSRRPGDIQSSKANPSYAKKLINWEAKKTLDDMCKDSWDVYNAIYNN